MDLVLSIHDLLGKLFIGLVVAD